MAAGRIYKPYVLISDLIRSKNKKTFPGGDIARFQAKLHPAPKEVS